jgi:ribosomal protein L37E
MLKIYCSDCGAVTEYSLNKPKFCSSCGFSFTGQVVKKEEKVVQKVLMQKPTIAKRPNIEPEDYEDDDTEITEVDHVPEISNLSFDIDTNSRGKETIGSIMGSSAGQDNELRKNKTFEKVDKKKVMEEFAKEGGAIRPLSRSVSQSVKRRKGQKDG